MNTAAIQELADKIQQESSFVDALRGELAKAIIGQEYMVDRLILSLLSNGHVLLEGVPGLAKTLAIKTLSAAIRAKFSRIQFTPDLLPADVLGTMIYNPQQHEFTVKKGPVFANFILADEINRASAKVQSALLQAMQEREVTIGDETFRLEEPFLVMATQNPLEQEGTYPLPEAQVDRFMLKLLISYPTKDEERMIIRRNILEEPVSVQPVIAPDDILQARQLVREVYLDEKIEQYVIDIVFATRNPEEFKLQRLQNMLHYGSSPRGSISLALAAKSYAFMQHRAFVIPDDIRSICHDVLRHRIGLTYEAEAEQVTTDEVINEIIRTVEVP